MHLKWKTREFYMTDFRISWSRLSLAKGFTLKRFRMKMIRFFEYWWTAHTWKFYYKLIKSQKQSIWSSMPSHLQPYNALVLEAMIISTHAELKSMPNPFWFSITIFYLFFYCLIKFQTKMGSSSNLKWDGLQMWWFYIGSPISLISCVFLVVLF